MGDGQGAAIGGQGDGGGLDVGGELKIALAQMHVQRIVEQCGQTQR